MIKWGWQERHDLVQAIRVANMDLQDKLEKLGDSTEYHISNLRDNFKAQVSRNNTLAELLNEGEEIMIGEW